MPRTLRGLEFRAKTCENALILVDFRATTTRNRPEEVQDAADHPEPHAPWPFEPLKSLARTWEEAQEVIFASQNAETPVLSLLKAVLEA